ncbi:MAG: hypothetical protein M0Q91_10025 [Methanoregula sp.]|jgi:hypothetical protein|nr:hypothetical protein [Methanoregula sp.]
MQQISLKDKKAIYQKALADPAWWVKTVLGQNPWQKQIEILESVRDHRVTAVKSAHGVGKSWTAASVALWFLYTHRPSIVLTTAPTDRQVKGILWKEIRMSHQKAKYPLGGTLLQQELKLAPNWFAWGFTAPDYDPDRFQGFHEIHLLVVTDEASGVSEEIFDGIDGVLTSDSSRLLMIGNPTNPAGRFAREFKTAGTSKISISAFDTPNFTKYNVLEQDILNNTWEEKITGDLPAPYLVTPRWVSEQVKRGWSQNSPLYLAKVLAQFPQSAEDTLIPLHLIDAAVERTVPPSGPVELAVDVARFGSDTSIIIKRVGPIARILKKIHKTDTMELTGHIIHALQETKASVAKIDSVGIGAGVYDRLNEQNLPVMEMQAGGISSDPERYANLRAEWWWGLRQRFEDGDIDIEDDEEMISQLANIKYKVTSKGQILIESKDDMKKRGMSSPDEADALMMVFGASGHIRDFAAEPTEEEALGIMSDIPSLWYGGGVPELV